MDLHIFSYQSLVAPTPEVISKIKKTLSEIGILGVSDIPHYATACDNYIHAVRAFSALPESIKQQYCPLPGKFEGYECGAEQFKDSKTGEWVIDDKKASYYAYIPDSSDNIWPKELDLKSAYLHLGELIFNTGKILLNSLGLNHSLGIDLAQVEGYGRMLHYQKEHDTNNLNPNWCGAHYDHSLFTGLIPAYYYRDGNPIAEPTESGLYIKPTHGQDFKKVTADDKSILLFQVGEFGQLASNDAIAATKHVVKKAYGNIERFTLAVFFNPSNDTVIHSTSKLTKDHRFSENQLSNGTISFEKWSDASFKRYDVSSDD
jgi:hypothetical protein